jgi:hypothetical protein
MQSPVYNSAIPDSAIPQMKPANRALTAAPRVCAALCTVFLFSFLFPAAARSSPATTWSDPEQQLARKIVAVTGPGAVTITVENRSSLTKKESDIVGNGLRSALEALGIQFVPAEQSAASVAISFSENQSSYVWVAEVHQSAGDSATVMVSTPRTEPMPVARESVPLLLHKTALWKQPERILDVAVFEESSIPTRIAVLGAEQVTLYRWQGAKWEPEQSLAIAHIRPWPRDLRGRLVLAKDHLLDVYLPGVSCRTASAAPLALNCKASDDPWPLAGRQVNAGATADFSSPPLKAFFAPARNYFTGVISPRLGKFDTVPKFYSLAFVPRDKYVLWLFVAIDGQIHMIDGVSDLTVKPGSDKSKWSSDIASIQTACGAGWQVLGISSSAEDKSEDSVRAYEFPDREPIAVSAPVGLSGEVTALWTESKGDSAVAVVRHRETGDYEAFRLAVGCGQ